MIRLIAHNDEVVVVATGVGQATRAGGCAGTWGTASDVLVVEADGTSQCFYSEGARALNT